MPAMDPIRYSDPASLRCDYAPPRTLEDCLEALADSIGEALEQEFAGRGNVAVNLGGFSTTVIVRDPLVTDHDEPSSEYLLVATVNLRVRHFVETGTGSTVVVSPQIVGEITRREEQKRWSWAVTDTADRLGSFMVEVENVISSVAQ